MTPPKRSKKGGPNLRGGGPGMLELQMFLKMKDFFAEWNGRGMEGGPNFGIHPPNRKPVGRALDRMNDMQNT